MAKAGETMSEETNAETPQNVTPEMDSKYRMIIVAAQRSKQLQRGARPRVDMDLQRHKATRVALEEVQRGQVEFSITEKE